MGPKVNKRLARQTQYTQFKIHETYHLLKISSIVSMSVIHKFKLEEKKISLGLAEEHHCLLQCQYKSTDTYPYIYRS